jgi:hypothetical protein
MEFLGRNGSRVLFASAGMAAVVDESKNSVVSVDLTPVLSSANSWFTDEELPKSQSEELANAALTDLDISVLSSSDRMHTIPKAVQEEAKRALEWRKEFDRGGTPVGLNTARTLARGGQIGIKKIRHIAKYFPRHEVDKKGKGYKPGEPGYPSRGRIAWALWGGDAAQRWASAIVERENKKENSSLIASHGYYDFEKPEYVDFASMYSEDMKYMVRVRMDGSGIDRLYAIKPCGTVLVWDDGCWDDLGNIEHDIDTYDKTLDDPYDNAVRIHVPVDAETAITVAALFDANPFEIKSLDKVSPEESELFEKAKPYLNYSDMGAMVAAPEFKTNRDGDYTSEERSQKATSQLRDKLGRFAVTGSRVIIGGDPGLSGKIISQDETTQQVKVELDNGKTIDIAANQTQQEDTYEPTVDQGRPQPGGGSALFGQPLDTSGILGEPRTPSGYAAQMPGTLPPLTTESLQLMLQDWPAWVESQRLSEDTALTAPPPAPFVPTYQIGDALKTREPDIWYEREGTGDIPNAMNDPDLRKFLADPRNRGYYTFDMRNPGWVDPQKKKKDVYSGGKYNPKQPKKREESVGDRYSRYAENTIIAAAEEEANSKPRDPNEEYTNPRQSDVAPMYMALVAEDDPQAVMEVVALVPKSENSVTPMVFKREPGQWVPEPSILQDLQSPTPPPVVMLDNASLEEVVRQIDGPVLAEIERQKINQEQPVTAAAGVNYAENLRKYWLSGAGAQKIRWGSSGDFDRCVQQVSKFMGVRAESYCAMQYKAATGEWAGALTASIVPTEDDFLDNISLRARYEDAKSRVITAGAYETADHGSGFYIPLVIPEGIESGDGRMFRDGSITLRELPLPLLWQIKTGEGHNGSVVVGKIDRMERTDHGIGNAYGVFDGGVYGREAERLVRGGFIRGVSADLDQFEADQEDDEADEGSEGKIENGKIRISKARVMAVTLVPKPAFQECQIKILDSYSNQEDEVVPDGVYVDDVDAEDASSLVACGMVAGIIPTNPPNEWFENPKLKQATPLTVDDEGRVFGHIAAWHVDHIGMSFGTKPPRSRSKYAYFHTGVVRTEEGKDVPVGQLTLAGGHASLEASAQEAVRHYDDTASAIADVHAGEDAYGIWVAGALRPGTTPEQIRTLRASAPSGDWRPVKGHLELVAVCQVNVPGFPIARARVASGSVMALVAAGAKSLAMMKSNPVAELDERIARLEQKEKEPLVAAAAEAKERFRSMQMAAKAEELSARVKKALVEDEMGAFGYMFATLDSEDSDQELAVISRRVRERLAQEGKALPDGSFPIRNVNDLRNAVKAYGRAKVGSRAKVRRHIVKRARSLDRPDLVPENWKEASIDEIPAEGFAAAGSDPCWEGYVMVGMKTVDGKEVPNCVPESEASVAYDVNAEAGDSPKAPRERLAEEGLALPDGSYPIVTEGDLRRALWAYEKWPRKRNGQVREHIIKRAKELGREDMLPEIWPGSYNAGEDEIVLSLRDRVAVVQSMIAAGGLDRNRGNAERLRRYWTKGPGAAKIRWGTPGDWKRCVRYLSKYLGVRAKGYCQLRHKEATGVYTGSRLNPGRRGRNNSIFSAFSVEELGLFESLYGSTDQYTTEVTEFDMMMPLYKIMEEKDDLYDVLWEPDKRIVILLMDELNTDPSTEPTDDGYSDDVDSGDISDFDDFGLDDYDDDGLFAAQNPSEDLDPDDDDGYGDFYDDAYAGGDIGEEDRPDYLDDNDPAAPKKKYRFEGGKFTPDTQPRDAQGKFRKVLARLKVDLGNVGADRAIEKIEEAENLDYAGDYSRAAKAAGDLINIIDRLDVGSLNPEALENVRQSSRELGSVIANLPFAFGEQSQKIRYSDLPPALRDLLDDMITRVEAKIGPEDAAEATKELKQFMSGSDLYSQGDISSQMAKMLRLLT